MPQNDSTETTPLSETASPEQASEASAPVLAEVPGVDASLLTPGGTDSPASQDAPAEAPAADAPDASGSSDDAKPSDEGASDDAKPSDEGDADAAEPAAPVADPAALEAAEPAQATPAADLGQDAEAPADLAAPPAPSLGTEAPSAEAAEQEAPEQKDSDAPEDAQPTPPAGPSKDEGEQAPKKDDDAKDEADKPAPSQAAPTEGTAGEVAPIKTEGGDTPEPLPVLSAGLPGTPLTSKVGDEHVIYAVDQQTVAAARASAAALGMSLSDYLASQGIPMHQAGELSTYVQDKHGDKTHRTHREWSVIIKKFYSEDSDEEGGDDAN